MSNQINDLNLSNWKEYLGDISTDALWISGVKKNDGKFIIPKRDFLPSNDSEFHGLFIPEIPYQFIKRFTKKGEFVWDCFGGSGTTYRVAKLLERECVINDLTPQHDYIVEGDSTTFNPNRKVQLLIMHPPYHNIVKYSDKNNCGSQQKTLNQFLDWFDDVVKNTTKYLDDNRFLILVCGNIYLNSEEVTLGVDLKDIVRKHGFTLKSHIIKDYGETKGSGGKDYNLNYYRGLKNNYNSFYGDNIFILKKQKSKNLEKSRGLF